MINIMIKILISFKLEVQKKRKLNKTYNNSKGINV